MPRTSRIIRRRRKPADKPASPQASIASKAATAPATAARPRVGIKRAPSAAPSTKAAPTPTTPPIAHPKPQSQPDDGYVAVGRVLSPFGLKGEMRVQSLSDNPRRFAPKSKLFAGRQPVSIATMREAQGFYYVTFKGFADRSAVDRFRHALLQIPESDLPPLAEGEYYRFQLLGLRVVGRDGAPIGVIEEVLETGANDVYRVRTPEGGELLLPALDDVIITIDLVKQEVVADPPVWR